MLAGKGDPKMKSEILFVLALALSVPANAAPRPATPAEISAIRAAMQTKLKDADSAKFLRVELIGEKVCGQVNAKNAFGAYMGFRTFFGMVFAPSKGGLTKTTAYVLTIAEGTNDTVAAKMCRDEGFLLPPSA
jgi:hypothetical protein